MSTQKSSSRIVDVSESISTTAASEQLRAETRAFGNAAAKLNLQNATDTFLKAKTSLLSQPSEATKAANTAE